MAQQSSRSEMFGGQKEYRMFACCILFQSYLYSRGRAEKEMGGLCRLSGKGTECGRGDGDGGRLEGS